MEKEKINQLISKYERGETSLEEERELHDFFRSNEVPEELQGYANQFRHFGQIQSAEPAVEFDPFAQINFGDEDDFRGLSDVGDKGTTMWTWSLRIAAGFALLLLGFATGQFLKDNEYASTQQVAELQQEVEQMKSVLMNTGTYRQASAGERLSAVNLSTHIADTDNLNQQTTDILIYTMNNDDNVNVRIAAAEALFRFREDSAIRKALIHSLNQQEAPLMQITLIDMLVELKAKSAVNEMEKMLVNTDTREIVRERLITGIAQLKA